MVKAGGRKTEDEASDMGRLPDAKPKQARTHARKRAPTSHPSDGQASPAYPRRQFIGGPADRPPATVADLAERFRAAKAIGPATDGVLRELFGSRYELLKLGVPYDLALPEPEPDVGGPEYDRKTYRPLIAKARRAASKLRSILRSLAKAEVDHPVEVHRRQDREYGHALAVAAAQSTGESPPPPLPTEESWAAKRIRVAGFLAERIELDLAVLGKLAAGKPGRRADKLADETVRRLRLARLGDRRIAKALTILGIRDGEDSELGKDAVRQRRRRERKAGGTQT